MTLTRSASDCHTNGPRAYSELLKRSKSLLEAPFSLPPSLECPDPIKISRTKFILFSRDPSTPALLIDLQKLEPVTFGKLLVKCKERLAAAFNTAHTTSRILGFKYSSDQLSLLQKFDATWIEIMDGDDLNIAINCCQNNYIELFAYP